jgi:imidazolonepropionase-like amidohydrolase
MLRTPLALAALTLVAGLAQGWVAPPSRPALAIRHVTVIDATGAPPRADMTVLVQGDRITAVAADDSLAVPAGARVVDGRGKFLIPGLWDMHAHLTHPAFGPLNVANGVTGARHLFSTNPWYSPRRSKRPGGPLFPRLVAAERVLDGPVSILAWPVNRNVVAAANGAEARAAVRRLKADGEDFVKVYSTLPREAYLAAVAEARALGLPVVGHVPYSLSAAEASDFGQKSIEHLSGVALAGSRDEKVLMGRLRTWMAAGKGSTLDMGEAWRIEAQACRSLDRDRTEKLFRRFAKNGTWHVPCLAQRRIWGRLDDRAFVDDPRLRHLPPVQRGLWKVERTEDGVRLPMLGMAFTRADLGSFRFQYRKDRELVAGMHRAGVRLLAGTDSPVPYSFPGFGLHDELELLVGVGLTPLEALQAATRNPAEFLGRQKDLGTVEAGKLADLVLLDASPLSDVRKTRKIAAVVLGGRLIDRAALDAALAR